MLFFGLAGLVLVLMACRSQGAWRIFLLILALVSLTLSTLSKEAGLIFLPPAVLLMAFCLRGPLRKKNLAWDRAFGFLAAGACFALFRQPEQKFA